MVGDVMRWMFVLPESNLARFRVGLLLAVLSLFAVWSCGWSVAAKVRYSPVEGDVLFQSLPDPPGLDIVDAIEGSTGSPYSHCGVVVKKEGKIYVLEAMVPRVKETPFEEWIKRGQGKFDAYRLRAEHRAHIPDWILGMRTRLGIRYDYRYRMSDEAIYCSELPYDAWKELTGQEMGQVVKLGDLKWQKYREVILAVEGGAKVPLDRLMITPRDLAAAPQLELVLSNGL